MTIKRVSSLLVGILIFCVIVLYSSIQPCLAAFSLSVEPYEGGYDLRFGKIGTQTAKVVKEVTIRMTTDIGKQYRVYQRLEKPLTTSDGIEVDRNNFKMYTLINSNSKGTLERIEEFPVMSSDTVLYTSDAVGNGDSFRIVYTFDPSIDQVAGSYYGRMLYYVVPIDSAQDQVTEIINMYADLTNEGAVDLTTDTGFKTIRISSGDLNKISTQYPSVIISVKGNLGARYRIYQQIGETSIKGKGGERFDLSKVIYEVTDSNSKVASKQGDLNDLKTKSLVYSSDDLGSSSEIRIKFEPANDFSQLKADTYTGMINYYIEMDNIRTALEPGYIDSVDVEFDVEPIFRIIVVSVSESGEIVEERSSLLRFGQIGYKAGTKESKIRIKIESNMGRPYLVTQRLSDSLQTEEGYKISDDLFTFELEKEGETGAILKLEEEIAVAPEKDVSLFISNTEGNSDEFDVTYKLKVTPNTRGGNYATGISYSLSEL